MNKIIQVFISLGVSALGACSPSLTKAQTQLTVERESAPYFPVVSGRNINNRSFTLPNDFGGVYNLALMAFDRYQQAEVESWLGQLRSLESQYSQFKVYEVPTLPEFSFLQRVQLDFWMSAGIPDPVAREVTITLYTDVEGVTEALNIRDISVMNLVLVDREGVVYWQGQGRYSPELFQDLTNTVSGLSTSG